MGCPLVGGFGDPPGPSQAVFAPGCPLWQRGRLAPQDSSDAPLPPPRPPSICQWGMGVPRSRDLLSALGAPNWELSPF